jgi:hypothetical protein
MADENTIYYTDLGDAGIPGVIEYKRNTTKTDIVFKAITPMVKFELCFDHATLFFSQYGINANPEGTSIAQIAYPFKDFKQRDIFYTSKLNDLGHMVCSYLEDSLYFIKNTGSAEIGAFDIAEFNFASKKLSFLTEHKTATSLVNMDGTLLTYDHGSYFILKGKTDFKTTDSLKSKESILENESNSPKENDE